MITLVYMNGFLDLGCLFAGCVDTAVCFSGGVVAEMLWMMVVNRDMGDGAQFTFP